MQRVGAASIISQYSTVLLTTLRLNLNQTCQKMWISRVSCCTMWTMLLRTSETSWSVAEMRQDCRLKDWFTLETSSSVDMTTCRHTPSRLRDHVSRTNTSHTAVSQPVSQYGLTSHHNSKTNDSKMFKLGIGNELEVTTSHFICSKITTVLCQKALSAIFTFLQERQKLIITSCW